LIPDDIIDPKHFDTTVLGLGLLINLVEKNDLNRVKIRLCGKIFFNNSFYFYLFIYFILSFSRN